MHWAKIPENLKRNSTRNSKKIVRDDDTLGKITETVIAHLEGRHPNIKLPLDIQATAFQRQVWEALMDVPCSETGPMASLPGL